MNRNQEAELVLYNTFTNIRPKPEFLNTFLAYQELFAFNPSAFIITAPLHQRSLTDPLHMSITYTCNKNGAYRELRFHINGFQTVPKFISMSVTLLTSDGNFITLAEFD